MLDPVPDISGLLAQLQSSAGSPDPQRVEALYAELRRLAARYLARERRDHTLQATALVNEAYLRLAQGTPEWESREHFFGVAARVMRQVLVDHARARQTVKRSAGQHRIPMEDVLLIDAAHFDQLIEIHDALDRLAALDARQARVAELRLFAGLGVDEISRVMNISTRTVKRDWTLARAWLRAELTMSPPHDTGAMGAR